MQIILIIILLLASPSPSFAQFDKLLNKLKPITQTKLSDTNIAAGLKEALKVGINNAVKFTGKKDGYFGNEAIKIPIPPQLQKFEKGLRAVGVGPKLDEFVLSMNRAAEASAPLAEDIFINSILDMSIDDAQKILKGGDTSATDHFKAKTTQKLQEVFKPVINKKLAEFNVTKKYSDILNKYKTLPLSSKFPAPDISEYVTSKGLDGLFYVLGQEEKKIRTDPAARVTDMLKQVFK